MGNPVPIELPDVPPAIVLSRGEAVALLRKVGKSVEYLVGDVREMWMQDAVVAARTMHELVSRCEANDAIALAELRAGTNWERVCLRGTFNDHDDARWEAHYRWLMERVFSPHRVGNGTSTLAGVALRAVHHYVHELRGTRYL